MAPPPERARRLDLVVVGLVVVAGGGLTAWWLSRDPKPSPAPASSATTSSPRQCATTIASTWVPPEAAPPFEAPRSNLVVEAQVPLVALTEVVDAKLPKVLDGAQRKPIGAPGEITYQVTRGKPVLSVKKGALLVDLPIMASVEICKPLGPICPTYGRCQPTVSSRTTLPLEPTADWKLKGAAVAVSVQTGCSVAGLDATAEVKKAAETGRRRAQGQIATALKRGEAELKKQVARLARPIALTADTCVRVAPDAVRYQPVVEVDGHLRLAAAVEGRLSRVACDAAPAEAPALPPLSRAELGEPALRLVTTIAYDDLRAALHEHRPEGVAAVHAVRAHGNDLAVEVTLEGQTCGRTWVVMKLEGKKGRLVLAASSPVPELAAPWTLDPLPSLERLNAIDGVKARQDLSEVPPQWVVTDDGVAVVRTRTGRVTLVLDPAALASSPPTAPKE